MTIDPSVFAPVTVIFHYHESISTTKNATVKQSVWKMPSVYLKKDIGHQVFPL